MANIIFDFDGTIADSFDYVFKFLRQEAGKPASFGKDEDVAYRGMSMKDMALKLGVPLWRLPYVYFKGRRVMRGHMEHILPFAGMPDVIRGLHERGHILSIVSSNSTRNVRRFLRQHGLDECFNNVRGGTGLLGKATPIKQLCARYKVRPEDSWLVGDEVTDIASANTARVKSVAVTWGFASKQGLASYKPTALVERPAELAQLFKTV